MIPNKFHFIQLKGNRGFKLHHYLAIKSCNDVNNPEIINFYYDEEPSGKWWELAKPLVQEIKIKAPDEIFGTPIKHLAHKSDVVRLQVLIEDGGIYCDTDTIFIKPYKDFYEDNLVLGQQGKNGVEGLCPAVIMSEPNSMFIKEWLSGFKYYFKGGDPGTNEWCIHSVNYPLHLAKKYSGYVNIADYDNFFYPLYHQQDLKQLFEEDHIFNNAYSFHLWETCSKGYLNDLSIENIKTVDTTYNRVARRFI